MRRNYPKSCLLVTFTFLGILLTASLYQQRRGEWLRKQQTLAYGRFSAEQILDRAEKVGRALAPPTEALNLTTECLKGCSLLGSPKPVWDVACTDMAGKEIAYMDWDAESGNLLQVSLPPDSPSRQQEAVKRDSQVTDKTWEWLCRVGMAARKISWKAQLPVRNSVHSWEQVWNSADRQMRVNVKIDAETGALVLAQVVLPKWSL